MTRLLFLMLCLSSISAAEFNCPLDFSCLCSSSATAASEHRVHCSTSESNDAAFNLTIRLPSHVNIECENSPDWADFLLGDSLDLSSIRSLAFTGCELPGSDYNRKVVAQLGVIGVEFLKVDGLRGNLSRHDFDAFPELKTLVLSNNYLGDVEADLLYELPNLKKLELQATNVQIPHGFFNRSRSLLSLDLSNNDLRDLGPGTFAGLKKLWHLNLRQCNMNFIHPQQFSALFSLRSLDISMNNLGTLPDLIFRDLTNLKIIDLSWNNFTILPTLLLFVNRKLKVVKLSHNKANLTELPPRFFSGFANLKSVWLEDIGLRVLPDGLFWRSSSLEELNLSRNRLLSLSHNLLKDSRELRRLNLSSNELTFVPDGLFDGVNKLIKLDLSRNNLTVLSRKFSFGLNALRELNVENNSLKSIDVEAFVSLTRLKIAKFARNRLNLRTNRFNIFGHLSPFHYCHSLQELDLSYNNVTEMFGDWIYSHSRLRKLNLSHNSFSYLKSEDLQFYSEPLYADLSHNHIKTVNLSRLESISSFRNRSRNVVVDLNDNPIECNCEVYSLYRYVSKQMKPKALEYVKLIHDLRCVSPKVYQGRRLAELNSSMLGCSTENKRSESCVSGGICDCWINPLEKNMNIDCTARNLTEAPQWINSRGAEKVSINLSGNKITKAPNMLRNGYDKVWMLNLSGNQIGHIDASLVSAKLKEVNLNDNNLTFIDLLILRELATSISTMTLYNNPLSDVNTSRFGFVKTDKSLQVPMWQRQSDDAVLFGFLLTFVLFLLYTNLQRRSYIFVKCANVEDDKDIVRDENADILRQCKCSIVVLPRECLDSHCRSPESEIATGERFPSIEHVS